MIKFSFIKFRDVPELDDGRSAFTHMIYGGVRHYLLDKSYSTVAYETSAHARAASSQSGEEVVFSQKAFPASKITLFLFFLFSLSIDAVPASHVYGALL